MIDTHVHVNTGGQTPAERALIALTNAQIDLEAGFTTVLDMDSRGGFNTVDLRDAINAGSSPVRGCRWSGSRSISAPAPTIPTISRCARRVHGKQERQFAVAGPGRGARGQAARGRLDQDLHDPGFRRADACGNLDATLVASPSLTSEEVDAIVDEAHRLGLKVACHTYGGEGMFSCLNAGVDAPNHLLELDEAGVKILLQKRLPFVVTLDDLIALEKGRSEATGGKTADCAWRSRRSSAHAPQGCRLYTAAARRQMRFRTASRPTSSEYYVRWGMTPAQALQTAFLPAAEMLNYGWANHVGSLEKGKFADVIAVSGNPLQDVGSRTGEVCDEGRNGGPRRTVATAGFIGHPVTRARPRAWS